MRLIDADRLKRQVEGRSWRAKGKFIELIDASATTIKCQTVQVSFGVKHGHWVDDFCSFVCSVCGERISDSTLDDYSEPRYCPNCGARMDLNLENEDHHE